MTEPLTIVSALDCPLNWKALSLFLVAVDTATGHLSCKGFEVWAFTVCGAPTLLFRCHCGLCCSRFLVLQGSLFMLLIVYLGRMIRIRERLLQRHLSHCLSYTAIMREVFINEYINSSASIRDMLLINTPSRRGTRFAFLGPATRLSDHVHPHLRGLTPEG